jgi:hypothetical protein
MSGSVEAIVPGADGPESAVMHPFPAALNYDFSSAKISGELAWSPGIFQFRLKAGHNWDAKKDPFWDGSFSASVDGRAGRFGLKITCDQFPGVWSGTLSWRFGF